MMSFLERVKGILWPIRIKIYRKTSSVIHIVNNLVNKSTIDKAKISVIIRQIVEEDVEEYCKVRSTNSKEVMLERLLNGHIGICAIHEGIIVSYGWWAIDEFWLDEHKVNLKIPPQHRYGYDGYTHTDYRRLGIHHELRTTSYPFLIEKGYPLAIIIVHPDNEASLRALEKSDGNKLGILHTTHFLEHVYHSIESDNEENKKQIKAFFNI